MKIPSCVWHFIKLIGRDTSQRYNLDGIRFHYSGEQKAVFTDGKILVVAGWPEPEPADLFIPRAILCCLSGYFHDECDCGQSEVFSPVSGKAVVIDDRAIIEVERSEWSISFKNEPTIRCPDYESIMRQTPETNPPADDFDPLLLSKLFTLFADMDVRRITWTSKNKGSPMFFAGKNDQVSLRGCIVPLNEPEVPS